MARITIDQVRESLDLRSGRILYRGTVIGSMVQYGAPGAKRQGNVSSRTEYASRIYGDGLSIEETGSKAYVVLDRVARKLAKAINEGRYASPEAAGPKPEIG